MAKRCCRDYNRKVKCPPAPPICADCGPPKHPCPQGSVFACCTGSGLQNTSACPTTPRSLVCCTVDTTCLCKPLVTLNYNSIINASITVDNPTVGATDAGLSITLTFQVKKSCTNGQNIECGSWTFTRNVNNITGGASVTAVTSDSYGFTFCDCNPCPACCTYSVELASCTLVSNGGDANTVFAANFGISVPTVTLLANDACPQ